MCHIVDQPSENGVNTSSPSVHEDLHTSPSLKNLDWNLDAVDFPQVAEELADHTHATHTLLAPP
jgi:hypothetical protein